MNGNINTNAKTLYVRDFGAVGDGVTDDAFAIQSAIHALRKAGAGSTLIFEPNKRYYYKENKTGNRAVIYLRGDKDLTFKGDHSRIVLGGYKNYYLDLEQTSGITIEGLDFDYGEYKPAFKADIESIDVENCTAIAIADREIHLENGESYAIERDMFACIDRPDARWHLYISSYEMIDSDARKFKINFNTKDKRTVDRLTTAGVKEYGLICMMPRSGNTIERAFSVHHNNDFTMRNVNAYSGSRHGFSLQYNTGEFLFENVNVVRSPEDYHLHFVSWGDFFHLLQNRAHYVWKNCKVEWNYDDVFNISSSLLVPRDVYSKNSLNLYFLETGGEFAPMLPGDRMCIIDSRTGKVERTTIKEVVRQDGCFNHVILNDDIEWLEATDDIYVYDEDLAAADMEMIDCDLDGTFRTRASAKFINTRFYVRRYWVGLETKWEGPLTRNVLFKDCKFEYDNNDEVFWHFETLNKGDNPNGAHIENVVFENCTGIDLKQMERSSADEIIIR